MLRSILRTFRFFMRRGVLLLVNLLAAPADIMSIQAVRCFLLRAIGLKLGRESQLSESLYIYDGRNFQVGTRCKLGAFCKIWDFSTISIGDDLLASHGLTLISGTHLLDEKRSPQPAPISIGFSTRPKCNSSSAVRLYCSLAHGAHSTHKIQHFSRRLFLSCTFLAM
jgi:acetyltransferase-like isoleucine patch superfamily enzyme